MTGKRFEIFPQNVTKDGTLIIIQKGLTLYNISDIVDLLNELHEENKALKSDRARYEEECRLDVFKELSEENEQLNQDRTRLLNFLRRELEYDVGDEIYDILHNKFYDKVWWDEENEKITSEYIKKDHEEWIKPR